MADVTSSLPQLNLNELLALQKLRDAGTQPQAQQNSQPNALMGGLKAGIQETQAGLYGAAGAVGTALGIDSLKKWGDEGQTRNLNEAQQVGRPDLEGWVTDKSLSQLPAYAVYQTAKWAPVLAGAAATEGLGGALAVSRTAPQLMARYGLSEAAAGTAAKEMLQRGVISAPLSAELAGAGAAGVAGVGEMYQNAKDAGIDTPSAAAGALALGLPYGALEMVAPRGLVKSLAEGLTGTALKRAAGGALKAGAQEMVTEGAQTGLEMLFRPDLSAAEKADNIIKGALTGGFVGGFAGGATGVLSKKPEAVTNQDNSNYVDKVLAGQNPKDTPSPTAPVEPQAATPVANPQNPPSPSVESSAMPASTQTLWENAPKQDLVKALTELEKRVQKNEADPADVQLMNVLRGELDRRDALKAVGQENVQGIPEAANVAQIQNYLEQRDQSRAAPTLFTPEQLTTPQQTAEPQPANVPPVEPPTPPAESVEDLRAKVRDIISDPESPTKRADDKFIRELGLRSEPELGETVLSQLESTEKDPDARTKKLAQYFGFMDESGNMFDLNQAMTNAGKRAIDPNLTQEERQQATAQVQNLNGIAQLRAEQTATEDAQTAIKANFGALKKNEQGSLFPQEQSAQGELNLQSAPARPTLQTATEQNDMGFEPARTTRATPQLAQRFAEMSQDPTLDAATQKEAKLVSRQLTSLAQKDNPEMSSRLQKRVATLSEQMTSKDSIYSQPVPSARIRQDQVKAERSQADAIPAGPAIWANKENDQPVVVLEGKSERGPDGKWYRMVQSADGTSTTGVPYTELKPLQTGEKNANEKSGATSVYAREPATTSGPMGERDAQGTTVTTESLSKGNVNEETSSKSNPQQIAIQKGAANQKSSQEISSQAQVKAAPPSKTPQALNKAFDKAEVDFDKQLAKERKQNLKLAETPEPKVSRTTQASVSRARPGQAASESRSVLKDIEDNPLFSPDVKTAVKTAAQNGNDTAPLMRMLNDYNEVNKVLNDKKLNQFHRPVADAWNLSVKNNNPEILSTALTRAAKAADRLKPSEFTIAALALRRMPAQGQRQEGMSVTAVESMIRPLTARWSGLPKVRVVSENDPNLSEQDRKFLKDTGVFQGYGAFTWQNEKPVLLLNADRLTPREVMPTLFHEALGHFGLRSAYGLQLRELMREIYNTTPAVREAVDAYIAERPELQQELASYDEFDAKEARAQLTEEVLAEQSERGIINQGIFSRLKAFVENFARMMGLRKGAFSKDEITSILRIGQQSALNPSKLNEFYVNQTYIDPTQVHASQPVVNTNVQMKNLATRAKKTLDDFLKNPDKMDDLVRTAGETRNNAMGMWSIQHLAERYGSFIPGVENYYFADINRRSTKGQLDRVWSFGYNDEVALGNRDPQTMEILNKLKQFTAPGIDPRKGFDQQSKTFKNETDPDLLQFKKDQVAKANQLWEQLSKNSTAVRIYEDLRVFHDMQTHSTHGVLLHNQFMTSEQIPENIKREAAKLDPIANFKQQSGFDIDSSRALAKANKFFQDHVDKLVALAQKYSDNAYGEDPENLPAKEKDKIDRVVDPLQAIVKAIKEDRGVITEYPYFHLGRLGEFSNSFDIRSQSKDADGKPVTNAADRKLIQDALKKKGIDVELVLASNSPRVFIKVDSATQQDTVDRVLKELAKEGIVSNTKIAKDSQNQFSQGLARWQDSVLTNALSRHQQQIEDINASDLTPNEKSVAKAEIDRQIDGLRNFMLDTLPSTSAKLVAQNRAAVPGYMSDMARASAHRAQVWSQSISELSSRRLFSDAMVQMNNAVAAEGANPDRTDGKKYRLMASVVNELKLRDAIRPFLTGRTWHDTVAAWNHTFFLALSPSYVALQFSQVGVTLWPRLVQDYKNVSYLEAATTIAKVSPSAIKIVKAMIAQGQSEGSFNWADSPITLAALNRTNLDQNTKEFILRFVNDNNLDIGSASREQGRVIEAQQTGVGDLTLRVASSFGYYSEVATRLIAALSAKALYEKTNGPVDINNTAAYEKLIRSVSKTVNGAMIDYSTTNTARLLGKMGFAGELTKVMFTFYRYTAGILEMLARAINDGILNGAKIYPEAERADKIKGAQRFLMAHMTAMMVVSGTMGLPFASSVAAAINGLMGLFDDDDEPYDANASWRIFLASVFGKDVGEILAHGAGRAFGVEFSQRTSEADLLPFTKFLADRRSWKEAGTDWAAGMFGAPFSMVANIADGASDVANGDVMSGLTRMAPNFVKGPLKAADMYMNGAYMDKKNNKIPNISPGANEILMQAFGFMPSELAEVKEKARYAQVRKGILSREAADIRKNLATAVEQNDMAGLREWMARAQEFTAANPNIDILRTLKGVLSRRANERLGLSKDALEQAQEYPF